MPGPPLEPEPPARGADREGARGARHGSAGGARRARPSIPRLLGLDRSGPPPSQTLSGQPLRPWTIPNAIGFARLALIPVFLALALSSSGGVGAPQAILFAAIGWGDYADGLAARITAQYSRLGTLLDPITDRVLVLSGVVVCWRFELLPRWALAILVVREFSMLALARAGLRRGVELRINWPGRISVAPVMGSLFFALCGLDTLAEVLLYVGLALALVASALYVRSGARQIRALTADSSAERRRPPRPPGAPV